MANIHLLTAVMMSELGNIGGINKLVLVPNLRSL